MSIQIRTYEEKDRTALIYCIGQLQDHIASLDPLHRIRPLKDFDCDAYLKRTFEEVKKHNGIIYLAEDENEIVGCVVGIILQPDSENLEGFPSVDGKILELIILSEHRGKRIGALLMQRMEEYFSSHDCSVIKVDCFGPNKDAHAFYEKLGYTDRDYTLIKKVNKV
jgi:ribosomal protein S18 acetylase RimI-like enzyme